jgi:hypothetical protein
VRERNGAPKYRRAAETHTRIIELMAAGLSKRQVCEQSGVDYATVTHILSGRSPRRVLDRTKRRIMAVEPTFSAWLYIDATKTAKTVSRLHLQGYSYEFIAQSCKLSVCGLPRKGRNRVCRKYVADAIADFAEFVGRSPGVARDGYPNGRRALSNEQRRMTA